MRLPKTFKRLFIPYHANNHKARLRHAKGFTWLSLVALVLPLLINFAPSKGSLLGYANNISVESVFQLTNDQRIKNGLSPLVADSQLNNAARLKAEDMFKHNYWAHISPTGVQPWSFFNSAGYTYSYAGENLARDFDDSNSVVVAWMDSPGHRENILNGKYQDIGLAVVNGTLDGVETTLVVQEFGAKRSSQKVAAVSSAAVEENKTQVRPSSTPSPTPTVLLVAQITSVPPLSNEGDSQQLTENNMIIGNSNVDSMKISPMWLTKSWTLSIAGLLVMVFLIDMVVVAKVKLPRSGGKTWAHMLVLLFVITAILYTQSGIIK